METEYYVYHLGAEWCGPCKKLKRDVWADESLRKLMGDKSAKLYIFDVDDENDKKMFDFYKVRLYPTIIIVNKNTGEVLNRFEGFRTLDQMKDTIIGLGD
jgi:protein disulfide-isomerase